ncbi:MAG: hypothetical protein LBU89_00840 [Fibromonadaceae bacterium]|jgi:hypothetical protein|nr:hypothetical protein [Fibromonadaceae bacterium]
MLDEKTDEQRFNKLFYGKAVSKVDPMQEVVVAEKPNSNPEPSVPAEGPPIQSSEPAIPALGKKGTFEASGTMGEKEPKTDDVEGDKGGESPAPAKKGRDERISKLTQERNSLKSETEALRAKIAEFEAKGDSRTVGDHARQAALELQLEGSLADERQQAAAFAAEHPGFSDNFGYYGKLLDEFRDNTFRFAFKLDNRFEVINAFMAAVNNGELDLNKWVSLPEPLQRTRIAELSKWIKAGHPPVQPNGQVIPPVEKKVEASIVPEKGRAPVSYKEMTPKEKFDYLFNNPKKNV